MRFPYVFHIRVAQLTTSMGRRLTATCAAGRLLDRPAVAALTGPAASGARTPAGSAAGGNRGHPGLGTRTASLLVRDWF